MHYISQNAKCLSSPRPLELFTLSLAFLGEYVHLGKKRPQGIFSQSQSTQERHGGCNWWDHTNTTLGGRSINLIESFRAALTASINQQNKEDRVSFLIEWCSTSAYTWMFRCCCRYTHANLTNMEAMWVVIEIMPLGPRVQPLKPHSNSPHKTFSFTGISVRGKNLLSEAVRTNNVY